LTADELINALCLPESYPHPVEVITTIETHISIVFLTGPYAYKLKKNVDFGFLDFSSIAKRKKFCDLELKLNKRYAPHLYLAVLAIYVDENNQVSLEPTKGHSAPIDYLVKMNQFDPNQVLGRLLKNEGLSQSQTEALAIQIADFHLNAEIVESNSCLGQPKTILQPMLDNFPTLYKTLGNAQKQDLDQLHAWTLLQFNTLQDEIKNRKMSGYVRACHGDLHIDNITLMDGQPVLFDGIEFNENFRWIDVISDLAFLLIDLDYRKQPQLNRMILSLYLSRTNDFKALKLLSFYQVYRALVRAKITALRAAQLPPPSLEHQLLMQKTTEYVNLANHYTQCNSKPKLILLQGVSGSGKSHLANALLRLIDAIVISSDRTRKQLYGIAPLDRLSESEKAELYSPSMNQKTYQTLLNHSRDILSQGKNLIVDATFLKKCQQQPFTILADELNCPAYVIYIESSAEIATQAIQIRSQLNNNPSDADDRVMHHQLKMIEPPLMTETSQSAHKTLTLNAKSLRAFFPSEMIQEFLNLPIK
jgi:aminoglycoside phosphotransferase family enzyme/predicted kinase